MKKILFKSLIIAAPFLLITAVYIVTDPFKVLYHYDHLYKYGMPNYVQINRDYATIETFKNNNLIYHYDSYIFGSSRSGVYRTATWAKLIGADLTKCIHLDGAGESIYGIERKLHYLDK